MIMPMYIPRGCRVEIAAEIKKRVNIPVSVAGRINDPFLARDIIAQKKVDWVDFGRQMIADPYFPQKIADGQIQDICACIACNYCHGKRIRAMKQVRCAVNPWAGREAELGEIKPAMTSKKVMVVGGGIAGMQAAIWLRQRGHRVSLCEKGDRLGGQTLLATRPPGKEEINRLLEGSIRQIKKLNIKVHLKREITPEWVIKEDPHTVVIATGGRPIRPQDILLKGKMKWVYAWDILSGKEKPRGKKIVVLGGGFVGAETADFICTAGQGEEVWIVEMRGAIAYDLEPAFRQLLMERLQKFGVKMVTHFRARKMTAKQVLGEDVRTKDTIKIDADTVVMAVGTEPVEFPLGSIRKKGIKFFAIGDARSPRGIAEAVREGYLAGTSI
jgi:2,4-dienoyl-CoA reductase (NADPH2)